MTFYYEDHGRYHTYHLDGAKVPGVTTLLNKGLPKPALVPWAAKMAGEAAAALLFGDDPTEATPVVVDRLRELGRESLVAALAAAHQSRSSEAKAKGSDVHKLAELVLTEDVKPPPALVSYVDGYVAFLEATGIQPIMSETVVGSRRHQYGGRFDLLAWFGGERWLLDIKTGKGIYGETACQLAAYARAEVYLDAAGEEQAMPEIPRIGALHVTESGTVLYPLGDVDLAFAEFLHIKAVADSMNRREALVRVRPMSLADAAALF